MSRSPARSVLQLAMRTPSFRVIALVLAYSIVLGLCIALAYLLRFDFDLPDWLTPNFLPLCLLVVCVHLLCMFPFHQFDGLLSYFSTPDLRRLIFACSSAAVILGALRLEIGRAHV